MNAQEAIAYLNSHSKSAWKLGLERTQELLKRVGDPQKALRFVHVAGTNGKGSTCAMTEMILRNAGYRTGLYPSPYIEDFRERIQICGEMIPEEDLGEITTIVAGQAEQMADRPTHFELITAIGMIYFARKKCDIVVLEVGLGGEYDSTNVIDPPEVAAITNIGLDHTEYLGDTVEKIAETKSGIIKPGSAVAVYDNEPSVVEVIERHAHACGDRIYYAKDEELNYPIALLGPHQIKNAQLTLAVIHALRDRGWKISDDDIRKGLAEVRWPARFEVLRKDPYFILDGGHNPQCAQAMVRSIEQYIPNEKVTFLMGMLGDKDYQDTLDIICPYAKRFVTITPDNIRALSADKLAEEIKKRGIEASPCDDIMTAIRLADDGGPVIAFGSLYSAGAIRRIFSAYQNTLNP